MSVRQNEFQDITLVFVWVTLILLYRKIKFSSFNVQPNLNPYDGTYKTQLFCSPSLKCVHTWLMDWKGNLNKGERLSDYRKSCDAVAQRWWWWWFCQQEHKVDTSFSWTWWVAGEKKRVKYGADWGQTCKAKSCLMRWKEASHGWRGWRERMEEKRGFL